MKGDLEFRKHQPADSAAGDEGFAPPAAGEAKEGVEFSERGDRGGDRGDRGGDRGDRGGDRGDRGGDRGDRGDRGGDRGDRGGGMRRRRYPRRKVCEFCVEKAEWIDYKDARKLRRFISDRGKILPRRMTGTCSWHQRILTQALKRARHIALLPFKSE